MQTADSLEKTLILGKTEGRRRRGHQKIRWLDGITDSVHINLGKLQKMVRDRVAWSAAVHRDVKSWTRLEDWTTTTNIYLYISIQKYKNDWFHSFCRENMKHTHNSEAYLTSAITLVLWGFFCIPNVWVFLFVIFSFLCDYPGEKQHQYSYKQSWPGSQIPMYLFLSNFSFLEICYVSVTLSRISINLQSEYIYIYIFFERNYKDIFYLYSWGHRILGLDRYVLWLLCGQL